MHRLLAPDVFIELPLALRHRTSIVLAGGRVTILGRPLAGCAVCCMTVIDDDLWIIVDLEKPLARRHARAMLRECGIELMCGIPDPWAGTDEEFILVPEPAEDEEPAHWSLSPV